MRTIALAILSVIAAILVGFSALYALGPHAAVAEAFRQYRAAYIAQDVEKVMELTSPDDIQFWDEQRRRALAGSPETVKSLDYRRRSAVIRLRADVLDGRMPLTELQNADARQLYAATRDLKVYSKLHEQMEVLFVVPTGPNSARGYLRLTQLPGIFSGQHQLVAIVHGVYYNFAKQGDGRWLIDPTPMLEGSARSNEELAIRFDPTGNAFMTQSYNGANDPTREAKLWEPLVKE